MQKIRICIGSDDGLTMAKTHLGDTKKFYCYDLIGCSASQFVGERVNSARNLDHAQVDKMQSIITLLKDVDIFVAQQKSPNFIKIARQTKYQPVVVDSESIPAIIALLQEQFEQLYAYVERRRNGEVFAEIPMLSADC
jgi:UDP-N-acetylglucosamine enolpyruvyl transferase